MFTWYPFYIFIIASLLNYFRPLSKGLWIVLVTVAMIIFSDSLNSRILKTIIARERPCNTLELQDSITLRASCGVAYSFPSSHAVNHGALSFFLMMICWGSYRFAIRALLGLWLFLTCLGQVHVGVHFPLDVLAGALLGASIARIWYKSLYKRLITLYIDNRPT